MGIGLATLQREQRVDARGRHPGRVLHRRPRCVVGGSRVPAHILKQLTPLAYVASLVPLVLVLFIGRGKYGNHWINLGFFNFQPSGWPS